MAIKEKTAIRLYLGVRPDSGSKSQDHVATTPLWYQSRLTVRRFVKSFIVNITLRGLFPYTWADRLVGGLFRHD